MAASQRFKRLLSLARAQDLFILVWGPGAGTPGHDKRQQVRDELRQHFPNGEVHFSEDPLLDAKLPADAVGWPVKTKQMMHLGSCSLCVVLDVSMGPGEEIAHFSTSKWAYKLYVLTHERYRGSTSLPAVLRENLNQEFFSEDEFTSCNLVKRVLDRTSQIAFEQFSRPD